MREVVEVRPCMKASCFATPRSHPLPCTFKRRRGETRIRRLIEALTRQLPVAVFIFCIGHPSRFRLYFCSFYSKSLHLPSCIFRLGYHL